MSLAEWETVTKEMGGTTKRIPVPGGWLYRTVIYNPSGDQARPTVAMAFVPELEHGDVAVNLHRSE